jgi:hypothetical protein
LLILSNSVLGWVNAPKILVNLLVSINNSPKKIKN